jgi:ribonuclease-3
VATESPQTVLDDLTLDDITASPREKTREEIIAEAEEAAFLDENA